MPQQIEPKIGIITALPKEYVAVKVLLEKFQTYYPPNSKREYGLGEIPAANGGRHFLVLALAVDMGNNTAAIEVTLLLKDFPSVESVIMVGIAGGVPNPHKVDEHVRLGDVVVSNHGGVVQYDFVKEGSKTIHRHRPRPPQANFLR